MSADTGVSASSLADTTPPSAAPNSPAKPVSEADFLKRQADEAARAMSRVVQLIKTDIGQTVDPRGWTREHPWIAMGIAAVGGFAAISLIPTSENRQATHLYRELKAHRRQRRRRIIRELREAGILGHEVKEKTGILRRLIDEAITVLRQAALAVVMGNIPNSDGKSQGAEQPAQTTAETTANTPPTGL